MYVLQIRVGGFPKKIVYSTMANICCNLKVDQESRAKSEVANFPRVKSRKQAL